MKIARVKNVKTPTRGTRKSAGLDFYAPYDMLPKLLYPNESVLIPSGIHVSIPKGFCLLGVDKSGIAAKKQLHVGGGLIDEDFQGEIMINLFNSGTMPQEIHPGDKIAQFIMVPAYYYKVDVVALDSLYEGISERGTGGHGSTGNK